MHELSSKIAPGVETEELDEHARKLIEKNDCIPSLLNYLPDTAKRPYPAAVCVSLNDEVVHGIPNENARVLKEGDIVSLDIALAYKKLIVDSAVTVPVGEIDKDTRKLLTTTKEALEIGISKASAGLHISVIGCAIGKHITKGGFSVTDGLSGHGVGYDVHEDPYVLNYCEKNYGPTLKAGMVLAVEPMAQEGSPWTKLDHDGYTFRTKDGGLSAHFEHTIAITEGKPQVLTAL